jgi:two-component system, response regulator PdtaR
VTDTPAGRKAETERPTRVLIAEDEALIRLDLKEMLQEEGFDVVAEVADGASAVRLTRELEPDLVILDVKMPVMDGIQAAEEIAKERLAAILILTAFSQRDLVEKARRAGAMAYLVKPFQKHDLLPAVEIAAGRFREMSGTRAGGRRPPGPARGPQAGREGQGAAAGARGLSEAEAFRFVQQQAMERRLTMRQVAEQVIERFEG